MCSTKQRLAAVLREQRTHKGWTLRQAAERASLAPSTLSRWESGTCLPRVPELESLLESLGAGRHDIVRILSSLNAPRATRAVRRRIPERSSEPTAPRGGDFLRLLRHRAGLTISCVASQLGVAASTVSRWESSVAQPNAEAGKALLALLGASAEESACLGMSGVGKIRSDRPPFDRVRYSNELAAIDIRVSSGDISGCELRLLQIQSNLWWSYSQLGAQDLLRQARVLFGELLVADSRYQDAECHAEEALISSANAFDLWGVRAQRVIARIEANRGPAKRPHLALLVLQPCLQHSEDDLARALVLTDMAELSLECGRVEEGLAYGLRARDAAMRVCRNDLAELARETIRRAELRRMCGTAVRGEY